MANEGAAPRSGVGARGLAGLLGLALMNGLNLNTAPLITGVWSDTLHLGPGQVGLLISVQLLTAAVAAIALSSRLHRVAPRLWGVVSGAVLVATNLWFTLASAYWALLAGSIAMGLALGALAACSAAAIAATARVDRNAALVSIGATLVVAALTVPAAHLAEVAGRRGLFSAQAVIGAGAVLLTAFLPGGDSGPARPQAIPLLRAMRSPFVLSAVCLELGTAGVWAFTERIGAGIGLGPRSVGDIIAASSLLGIAGAVTAVVMARPGRELSLAALGTLLFGAATATVALAPGLPVYAGALSAQAFFFIFAGPFVTAVAVLIDRSGGLAAAAHGWGSLAGALAPALTGVVIGAGHFNRLAALCAVATTISAVAMVAGARGGPRET